MEWTRYKVIQCPGGLGEVVQVKVRDVGTISGENTPPMRLTALRECEPTTTIITKTNKEVINNCNACVRSQIRVRQLESQVRQLEKQIHVNNILNTLMNSLKVQEEEEAEKGAAPSVRRRNLKKQKKQINNKYDDDDDEHPTLLEMMTEELRRQNLLHALTDLLERPTQEEEALFVEKSVPQHLKTLRIAHSEN